MMRVLAVARPYVSAINPAPNLGSIVDRTRGKNALDTLSLFIEVISGA